MIDGTLMDDGPVLALLAELHVGKSVAERVRECRWRRESKEPLKPTPSDVDTGDTGGKARQDENS